VDEPPDEVPLRTMQWLDEKIKFQRDGIYRHSGGPGLGKTTIATPLALGRPVQA